MKPKCLNLEKQELVHCIDLSKQIYQRNEKEFALLYGAHESTEFPYWNYERLDSKDKKTTNPRLSFVYWEHIYELAEQMLQTR